MREPTPTERLKILMVQATDKDVRLLHTTEIDIYNYLQKFHKAAWDLSYKTRNDDIGKIMERISFQGHLD